MAFDAYIELDGVPGESKKKGKENQIEIFSFSWGSSNPTTVSANSGISAGRASVSSFNVMKQTDKASPVLFQSCCSGKVHGTMKVTLRKTSGGDAKTPTKDFLVYTFTDVMVESVQWSGSAGGDDVPTESVSFAFTTVKIEYFPQDTETGKLGAAVSANWDIKLAAST